MYPLAEVTVGETKNGVGINIVAVLMDLGDFCFGGLKKGLAPSATFDTFEPCPHC